MEAARRKSGSGYALRRVPPPTSINYTCPQPFNDERLSTPSHNSKRTGGHNSTRAARFGFFAAFIR